MHMEKGRIRDWLVVLLLMAALILSFVDRIGLSLLVDPIRADLGISDAEIGLLQGIAFGLFFAVMGLPLGWLADRWSRKGTIMLGVGMWSVATAACGLAANFPSSCLHGSGSGRGGGARPRQLLDRP
ncbi:MFS transporter [Rhizorhabdus histidinilytica]